MEKGKFLTAEWRHLLMINYEVDPAILDPYLPAGTEMDKWGDRTLVSMVGFLFLKTGLLGIPIPFHRNFEEINLRFYVRRRGPDGWRRGVVFIKEIVPRRAIATVARVVYNENYVARRMRHRIDLADGQPVDGGLVRYEWQEDGGWNLLQARIEGEAGILEPGSEEEFITEHYWGYSNRRDGRTIEYRVEHPPWQVRQAGEVGFECDIERIYGKPFVRFLNARPASAFVAAGSEVTVRCGEII